MARLLFFLLLIAVLALGLHLWLDATAERRDLSVLERNRDELRIVAATPPLAAARKAEETRRAVQNLAGAACVEFSGIAGGADIARAREAFAAMRLGDRLIERRVEEITRHWVYMPPARDRRSAEATVAQLRRQGVGEMSIRPDNAISLGVFSTEEAARRFLASLEARGVRGAEVGGFSRDVREVVMLVKEPDSETVARLALLQRDYPKAQLRAVPCPA